METQVGWDPNFLQAHMSRELGVTCSCNHRMDSEYRSHDYLAYASIPTIFQSYFYSTYTVVSCAAISYPQYAGSLAALYEIFSLEDFS